MAKSTFSSNDFSMFASSRASGLGREVLRAARAQLKQVATGVLDSALQHLDGRALKGPEQGTPRNAAKARMREVLERDRAVTQALEARAQALEARAVQAPSAPSQSVADEPIRTRTLAKLLAAQGYHERALAMYSWLSEREPNDETLRAEIARLRA